MITIKHTDEGNPKSDIYTVKLGKQFICKFEHDKFDGLALCLQRAADAVELSEWAEHALMTDSKGG